MGDRIAELLVRNRMNRRLQESKEPAPRSYYKKVRDILNHQLGSYETGVSIENIDIVSETPGTITLKVDYEVNVQIPMVDPEDGRTYYEQESDYRTRTMTLDFDELDENSDTQSKDDRVKLKYWTDTWNMIEKYGIDDWEDHDSYISISKDSYDKMLNGSKNKKYIQNLRLKENNDQLPDRNNSSTPAERRQYANELLSQAKDTGDTKIAWELIDFLYDTELLNSYQLTEASEKDSKLSTSVDTSYFNASSNSDEAYTLMDILDRKLIDARDKLFDNVDIDDVGMNNYGDIKGDRTIVYQAQVYHFKLVKDNPKQIPLTNKEWRSLESELRQKITIPEEDDKYEYEVSFDYTGTTLKIRLKREEKI